MSAQVGRKEQTRKAIGFSTRMEETQKVETLAVI